MKKPEITKFERFAEITLAKYERYLPTAFDESLTLLEKMNKLIQYLNEIGLLVNEVVENWNKVMEWIMNDGLSEAVNEKLDQMVADGTFDEIINEKIFSELNRRIEKLELTTTFEPVEYFVNSVHGLDSNDGLTENSAFKSIGHALRQVPRIIRHEVVINVANGIYVENSFLDEWGRRCGIDTTMFTVMVDRNSKDATFPTGRDWGINKKAAKLSIVGESMGGVRIRGRNPEDTFDIEKHGRAGIKSRLRDFYIQNLTLEYYHTGLTAHEGGAVSGYNIQIENMSNVALLVESQQAKVEISNININTESAYCILNHNGQLGLDNSKIVYNGSAPVIDSYGGYVLLLKTTISSDTPGVGISNYAGYSRIDECTFDKLTVNNIGGTTQILKSIIKNVSRGVRNQAGKTVIGNQTNIFDCDYGVVVEGGNVALSNVGSIDGVTQKFNSKYGVLVEDGFINVSPYSYTNQGYNLKGPTLDTATDIYFNNRYPSEFPGFSNHEHQTDGWTAEGLSIHMNRFLNTVKLPDPITKTITLNSTLRSVKNLTSYHVTDAKNKLNEIIDKLKINGYVSHEYIKDLIVGNVVNDKTSHDLVRDNFNELMRILINLRLMKA